MNKGVYSATSASLAQERAMDVITNNLANMNTSGYKADRMLFQSYLQKAAPAAEAPTTAQVAAGTILNRTDDTAYMIASQSYTDFEQGSLQATKNEFDFALEGDGFFAVMTPRGERYTRGGAFKIDKDGVLVTSAGHKALDESGKGIFVGDAPFSIREDGALFSGETPMGKIKVVDYPNRGELVKNGDGLFEALPGAVRTPSTAAVKQGYLETSNINPVAEMTRMITAMRTYEAFQKTIHSQDDMTQRLINDVARP